MHDAGICRRAHGCSWLKIGGRCIPLRLAADALYPIQAKWANTAKSQTAAERRFCCREEKQSGPVSFATKQKPHRPGIATALGLRAGDVLFILTRITYRSKEYPS
jgi:hypothetical protein